jgi:YVTN family beta-propeller protein
VTASRVAALALCAVAGLSLAATFARDTTTAVDVGVTEYDWKVVPGTVPVGTVVFNVHNDGDFVHDFSIIGHTTRPLKSRESATLTVVFARPGEYTYNSTWDDVDREMWGIFTVTGTPLATTTTPPPTTTTTTQSAPTLPLRRVADVPLPGGSSRFDYQSFDPTKKRLYIAHLGADAVVVFDVRTRRVVRNVSGIAGPHGVLAVPALGRVYAAATSTHELVAIRDTTLSVVARTRVGTFPDGLAYDPVRKRVYVSDKDGDAAVVVGRAGRVVRRLPLGGEAGNVKYDAGAKRMLVAVAGREQLVSIDPVRLRVVARTPLPGCTGAHGLQLDAARRLAYVACERNARLLVVDLKRRRVVQTLTVGAVPDVLALDSSLHRLYVAAESGVVAVFAEQGRKLSKLGQALLAPTAHSVAVDPSTHLVYFPLENVDGGPVLRIMAPLTRP